MTQELKTDNINNSILPAQGGKVLPIKSDARIEAFAKYILSLRKELPDQTNNILITKDNKINDNNTNDNEDTNTAA